MIDIDNLEALARAATPGPWAFSPMTETEDPEIGAANGSRVAVLVAADITKANSAYVAAANPAAVLDLIKEMKSYRRMFEAACEDLGEINEKLNLDPDDGGAMPILAAIEEMQAEALNAALQRAARELPDGYTITVEVERGAGGVAWCDPDGQQCDEYHSESLAEDVIDALADAIQDATITAGAAPVIESEAV